jgi:creatinine amidohydrolase/Fe(II)-dependent formamide hydrolase-like protein
MRRTVFLTLVALSLPQARAVAQSPVNAAGPNPPNTVFIESMTVVEIREALASGKTTAIIATAGTEQNGPHMVLGKHRYILEYTADKIARTLGNALVAPIVTYVPEGNLDPPSGHMRYPGTITVPQEVFRTVLEETARSLRGAGFLDIVFIGDSGSNTQGMAAVTEQLNAEWGGTDVRVHHITDYYGKAGDDATAYITEDLGIARDQIGSHAGISDTSQLMFVNPLYIRADRLAPGGGFEDSGVSGNPTLASAAIGERLLRFKIDNAVAQIRASLAAR